MREGGTVGPTAHCAQQGPGPASPRGSVLWGLLWGRVRAPGTRRPHSALFFPRMRGLSFLLSEKPEQRQALFTSGAPGIGPSSFQPPRLLTAGGVGGGAGGGRAAGPGPERKAARAPGRGGHGRGDSVALGGRCFLGLPSPHTTSLRALCGELGMRGRGCRAAPWARLAQNSRPGPGPRGPRLGPRPWAPVCCPQPPSWRVSGTPGLEAPPQRRLCVASMSQAGGSPSPEGARVGVGPGRGLRSQAVSERRFFRKRALGTHVPSTHAGAGRPPVPLLLPDGCARTARALRGRLRLARPRRTPSRDPRAHGKRARLLSCGPETGSA